MTALITPFHISHPSLKQASPSLTSSSDMLASGPFRPLSNIFTGRGSGLRWLPGGNKDCTKTQSTIKSRACFSVKTYSIVHRPEGSATIVTSFWSAKLMNLLMQTSFQVSSSGGTTSDKQQWIAWTTDNEIYCAALS